MTPHGEADPSTHLEPDQLRADRSKPLPPAGLGPRAGAALWVLRVVAIGLSVMVIFVFVHGLSG